MNMSKRQLSEEDIKARYITPAVNDAGWDMEKIRFEYTFTDGRIIVRGNMSARGGKKRADYVLFYKKNIPIAVIEAKDNRSEEHTSELQSRFDLVCRLLLE